MFNPINASNNIKQSFVDYITTLFSIADPYFARLFRDELMKDGMLSKGPYLDIGGSYKSGKSLKELVKINQASELFSTLEELPEKEKELKFERPLYLHQEEALHYARNGNNLVVTTGTGSGKTECFLLPILQSLLEELEAGTLTHAVRAIIIYPMNALANDQMEKLRKILATRSEITFGLYSGNTPHLQTRAEADYRKLRGSTPLSNEKISRETMQKEPPHILITNYSMLEYMMLRPNDDTVFSGASLRYIVLDEAHIYRGATGMETALLMRRLRARISKPNSVQYILTSATLGGKDADEEIIEFAENLCSATFKPENIIRSVEILQPLIEHNDFSSKLFAELNNPVRSVEEILNTYDADFAPNGSEGEKIFELMLRSSLFAKLRKVASVIKPISQIANEIGISGEELENLIAVSSKAVKNETILIKARYHFFLRALEGAFITLAGNRSLYLTRKEYNEKGDFVFECAICEDCGRIALVGNIENGLLCHPKQGYGEPADFFLIKQDKEKDFFSEEDTNERRADRVQTEEANNGNDYVLCPICGKIEMEYSSRHTQICEHSNNSHIKLHKARTRDSGFSACPACEFGNFRRFYVGYEAATAVLGTTLFEQLPEYDIVTVNTPQQSTNTGFFGIVTEKKSTHTMRTRQYLAFSDSRADAAFFACYMEKSYHEFLRRRGLWCICDKMIDQGRYVLTVREVVSALARLFEASGSFVEIGKERESQTDACRSQAYIAVMNELVSSRRPSGLVQLGKLSYMYAPKNQEKEQKWNGAIEAIANNIPSSEYAERDARALLNLLMIDTVYGGALDAGEEFILNADEREYLFFAPMAKKIVKIKKKGGKNYLSGWIPRQRTGKTKSFYPSTRMTRVMRAMDLEAKEACLFLKKFWENILGFGGDTEYALPVQDFNIILYDSEKHCDSFRLYRCEKCGRVTAYNCKGRCVNVKCTGILKEFNPASAYASNHYINLYSITDMKPFYIKEHTAQLSRERGAEYQKLFVDKKINALSSSTTFEMGVDVGNLETVFLRDVPPTPANYVQRAGRAGRNIESAAYALTYAKLSSHDFTYFAQPEKMISGSIKAPVFRLENEKIIRRHINAVAFSAFFKEHYEVYDGNNQSEFLNGGGYEKLKDFLAIRPSYLKNLLMHSIPSGNYGIEDWSWTEYLVGENGILESVVKDFRDTVSFLEAEREQYRKEGNDYAAAAVSNKLRNFRADKNLDKRNGYAPHKSLIDFLVRNNILPKYGFPVDTVELLPDFASAGNTTRPQMQRDLQFAVAEYAPGSEIVADGMLYTSRYIHKSPSKNAYNWEYGWYAKCPTKNCEADNFYKDNTLREDLICRSCGQEIKKAFWHKTLEPRRGFIAGNSGNDKQRPVKMRKPEKSYKTDDIYIGDPSRRIIDKRVFSLNENIIEIESTANDSLVVRTQTKFSVCTSCGYATGIGETYNRKHQNAIGSKCANEEMGYEFYLAHEFKTDVARITFGTERAADYDCMLSVLFALLEAISKELDIERNDIKGCLYKAKLENGLIVYSLVIYDAVAGGAGHSRRIVTPDGEVLSKVIQCAIKIMNNCDCEPSCYKCLRNYYNQKLHDHLNRKSAADFLENYMGVIDLNVNTDIVRASSQVTSIEVLDSTSLKGDYSSWDEVVVLFEDYKEIIETLSSNLIPLADSFEAQLKTETNTIEVVLLWENARIAICEILSNDDKANLSNAGWLGMTLNEINIEQMNRMFRGDIIG